MLVTKRFSSITTAANSKPSHMTNTAMTVVDELNLLTRVLFELSQQLPSTAVACVKEMLQCMQSSLAKRLQHKANTSKSCWPLPSQLLLLKLIAYAALPQLSPPLATDLFDNSLFSFSLSLSLSLSPFHCFQHFISDL